MKRGYDFYRDHPNPAIRLLTRIQETMPLRSIEHNILTCVILYLEGDTLPGWSVARWWPDKIQLRGLEKARIA